MAHDVAEVEKALREAVDDYGREWVDPNSANICRNVYVDNNDVTRRCIAAEVLHRLGVQDVDMAECNDTSIAITLEVLELKHAFTHEARKMLTLMQSLQDAGIAWGRIHDAVFAYNHTD